MFSTPIDTAVHKGGCHCGSVSYAVTGKPTLSAYCHCTNCQKLNACAFIHTIHFPAPAFKWTHTEPHETALDSYIVCDKPWKTRWRCKMCGCTVSSYNSKADKWSVWGGQLNRDDEGRIKGWESLRPTAHIFYGTRMLDIHDDLGKWEGYEDKSARI